MYGFIMKIRMLILAEVLSLVLLKAFVFSLSIFSSKLNRSTLRETDVKCLKEC